MSENKIILSQVKAEEKEILLLLERVGECLYGNIFSELNLSQTRGAEIILSLVTKGYIRNVGATSYYELNGKLIK